ncbi:MAG: DUF1232 domain-containing protein [Anaerolineae bacterium]|jgi:uncharacterized membrane protein YkvA (DUF1232 family)
MSEERRPSQAPQDNGVAILAWLREAVRQLRLAWRLFLDRRVPLWTKIVPPVALAYVLSPIDILSDIPPMGLNQLDDVAVLLLGIKLFIELAPPDVVREHLRELGTHIEEWRVVDESEPTVVEGRYSIKGPEPGEGGPESRAQQ